jgi:hypothetical protein
VPKLLLGHHDAEEGEERQRGKRMLDPLSAALIVFVCIIVICVLVAAGRKETRKRKPHIYDVTIIRDDDTRVSVYPGDNDGPQTIEQTEKDFRASLDWHLSEGLWFDEHPAAHEHNGYTRQDLARTISERVEQHTARFGYTDPDPDNMPPLVTPEMSREEIKNLKQYYR